MKHSKLLKQFKKQLRRGEIEKSSPILLENIKPTNFRTKLKKDGTTRIKVQYRFESIEEALSKIKDENIVKILTNLQNYSKLYKSDSPE
jgi:hypothetical protein